MAAEQQQQAAEDRRASFRRRCQTYDAALNLEPIHEQEGEQQCGAVVVFDWDDTLLPTTWLSNNIANVEDDAREGSGIPPSSRLYKDLERHAELVEAVLTSARSAGRVAIVTLARRPWVLTSSRRYLPGLEFEELLLQLDIPVFYAQEYTGWLMWWFTDYFHRADVLVDGKRNAIMGCLRQLHTAGCEVRGLVSVGDSVIEQRAAAEAVKVWTAAGMTPQQVQCKTVKLADKPTVGELGDQLRVLNASLRPLVHHQGEVGVSLDDYDQLLALRASPRLASGEKAGTTGDVPSIRRSSSAVT
jgi:hypothetical protein